MTEKELAKRKAAVDKQRLKFAPTRKKTTVWNTTTGESRQVHSVDATEYCKFPEWSLTEPTKEENSHISVSEAKEYAKERLEALEEQDNEDKPLTVPQIKSRLDGAGVSYTARAKKSELLELLENV
jgi:hypothetical protein